MHRSAFELKQSVNHRWCKNVTAVKYDLFCQARGTANRIYAAVKARYCANFRRTLGDCASANAWWRMLIGHVFGADSDVPLLCSPGGALVSDPVGKAALLGAWLSVNSHETLLSCRRHVILDRHSVGLPSECVMLS